MRQLERIFARVILSGAVLAAIGSAARGADPRRVNRAARRLHHRAGFRRGEVQGTRAGGFLRPAKAIAHLSWSAAASSQSCAISSVRSVRCSSIYGARGRTFDRDHGTLSMVFHPRFSENGFFYLWFSTSEKSRRANRLARFKVSAGMPVVGDVASEMPLITQPTGPHGHDGAMLLFGPDDYLYLSLGDGDERHAEPARSRQSIDRSFFGGVLRLDVDQQPGSLPPNPHPAVHPGTIGCRPTTPSSASRFSMARPLCPRGCAPSFGASGCVTRGEWRSTRPRLCSRAVTSA